MVLAGRSGLEPAGSQAAFLPRVPMLLTSRLRQLAVSAAARTASGATERTLGRVRLEALAFFGSQRAFMPTIAMAVNPNSVKFSQPKRWSKKDTREGSVFFHFTNSRGQNNDILTLSFAGNTGNIDLRGSGGGGTDTGALYKLLVWHNLYLMTREPMLLSDGSENVFSLVYSSPLFPEIQFSGFFSQVLEFEETATKPNSRAYTFEFTATDSVPPLDEVLQGLSDTLDAPTGDVVFRAENSVLAVGRDNTSTTETA